MITPQLEVTVLEDDVNVVLGLMSQPALTTLYTNRSLFFSMLRWKASKMACKRLRSGRKSTMCVQIRWKRTRTMTEVLEVALTAGPVNIKEQATRMRSSLLRLHP